MRADWFEPLVRGWSGRVTWEPRELREATRLLMEISRANGGEVVADESLPDEAARELAVARAEEALQRRLNRYAREIEERARVPTYSEAIQGLAARDRPALPFVELHSLREIVDVNSASAQALEALPAIGRATAARIIEYRSRRGPFTRLEDLNQVEGLGPQGLEKLRGKVAFQAPAPLFMTEELAAFARDPSFGHYAELVAGSGGSFLRGQRSGETPARKLLRELEETLRDVREHPYGVARRLGATRTSAARAVLERQAQARSIHERATFPVRAAALLLDHDYPDFVARLLERAEQSVSIALFFFRYVDERYPTHALVQQLIAAHRRGLDVRVILDRDAEGDVYNSRVINREAHRALTRGGVPVHYEGVERLTHTKLVVTDHLHVVIGSHNWTASSFFYYDDASVYVESAELAGHVEERFQALWREYGGRPARPAPAGPSEPLPA